MHSSPLACVARHSSLGSFGRGGRLLTGPPKQTPAGRSPAILAASRRQEVLLCVEILLGRGEHKGTPAIAADHRKVNAGRPDRQPLAAPRVTARAATYRQNRDRVTGRGGPRGEICLVLWRDGERRQASDTDAIDRVRRGCDCGFHLAAPSVEEITALGLPVAQPVRAAGEAIAVLSPNRLPGSFRGALWRAAPPAAPGGGYFTKQAANAWAPRHDSTRRIVDQKSPLNGAPSQFSASAHARSSMGRWCFV